VPIIRARAFAQAGVKKRINCSGIRQEAAIPSFGHAMLRSLINLQTLHWLKDGPARQEPPFTYNPVSYMWRCYIIYPTFLCSAEESNTSSVRFVEADSMPQVVDRRPSREKQPPDYYEAVKSLGRRSVNDVDQVFIVEHCCSPCVNNESITA